MLPIYLRRKRLKKLNVYNIRKDAKKFFEEEFHSFGSLNPDKTFYVIRRGQLGSGFFSNFLLVLQHIYQAYERNLIPVVDYETYPSWYQEEHAINGTYNVWEYYFKQISPYTLKEVYKSKNVFLSRSFPNGIPLGYLSNDDPTLDIFWAVPRKFDNVSVLDEPYFSEALKTMKLIKFNKTTQDYLEQQYNKIIPKNKKILGIVVRGTDYNKTTAKNHYIQPDLHEFLELCNKKFHEYQYDFIYISTEDEDKLNKINSYFRESRSKLLYLDRPRYKNYTEKLGYIPCFMPNDRKNGKYLINLEYLADTYILSQCDSLISGMTSGVLGACLMNGGKYEHRITLMNGRY